MQSNQGIVTRNADLSKNNRVNAQPASLKTGLYNALNGAEDGVYNHKVKWQGYNSSDNPVVRAYGTNLVVDEIHGYKGIPKGTEVVLRVSKGFTAIDFQ